MKKESIFRRLWDKFMEEPFYYTWFILGIADVVATLVIIIVGIVNYRTTGYYIPDEPYKGKRVDDYISQSKFGFLLIFYFIQNILALIEGFRYNLARTITSLVAILLCYGVMGVDSGVINIGIDRDSTAFKTIGAILGLGLVVGIFFLYKGTMAGRMFFITFILEMVYGIGANLILNMQQDPGLAIWLIILGVITWLVCFDGASTVGANIVSAVGNIGAPSTPYYTSAPSRSSYSDAREMTKTQDEIDRLRRKNEEMENSIKMHNRGALGYGYVDNKVTRRGIEENERRIKNLEKSLH